MKVHVYDPFNKNKKGLLREEEFTSCAITSDIDDYATLKLTMPLSASASSLNVSGFENIYVEDEKGRIMFGGIVTTLNVSQTQLTLTCYDHRWVLSRLILDEQKNVAASDDILTVAEDLITLAKSKRIIPFDFDRSGSEIAGSQAGADLVFEVGDDIAGCLQKIIQTIYARWAVRYSKEGDLIVGKMILRSVRYVTPEGVGIVRTPTKSEDGTVITLVYDEGNPLTNIQDWKLTFDVAPLAAVSKLAFKEGDVTKYISSPPDGISGYYAAQFGYTENFSSDYNATSEDTGRALSQINQVYPTFAVDITLAPDLDIFLRAGDRVSFKVKSPMLSGFENGSQGRIDSISFSRSNGSWFTSMTVNFMSPQKRAGTVGFLAIVAQIKQHLADLDKNYLKTSTPGS